MIRVIRNLWRIGEIARVLVRHDALFPLEHLAPAKPITAVVKRAWRQVRRKAAPGRPGQRLARALIELSPTFIKLGQALSTRPDLVGAQVADDLSGLQDRLQPFDPDIARATVQAEFGQPVPELFARFDDVPVAAASIAQVHFAETLDGRQMAVKILRPGVEARLRRDLDLILWLAALTERVQPAARRLRPVEAARTFERTVTLEMDLRFEAAAAAEMAENFADDKRFRIPAVDWALTGRRVMTIERITGSPVDERDVLVAAGHDPVAITRTAAEGVFTMVFRHGFFHGDLHPGNVFVDTEGRLAMIDFGVMGRVDRPTQRYLAEMLFGLLNGDYQRVTAVHFRAGYVPADQSRADFTQAIRSVAEPILGRPMNEISIGRLLAHLFSVTEAFGMQVQPHLLLLQKTLLTAEGIGRSLAPEANMWELARPLVQSWMIDTLGPEGRLREVRDMGREMTEDLPATIADARAVLSSLGPEGLRLHPETLQALSGRQGGARMAVIPWVLAAVLLVLLLID